MSNNIKKSLVVLSLAVVYVSGLATNNPPNKPPQYCSTPRCTSMQQDQGTNNQMPNRPNPNGNPNIPPHKDRPIPPN